MKTSIPFFLLFPAHKCREWQSNVLKLNIIQSHIKYYINRDT